MRIKSITRFVKLALFASWLLAARCGVKLPPKALNEQEGPYDYLRKENPSEQKAQ